MTPDLRALIFRAIDGMPPPGPGHHEYIRSLLYRMVHEAGGILDEEAAGFVEMLLREYCHEYPS